MKSTSLCSQILGLSFYLFVVTSGSSKADYLYTLTDSGKGIKVTYDSPDLIVTDLNNVPVTSTISAFDRLSFIISTPYSSGGGTGGIVVPELITPQVPNYSVIDLFTDSGGFEAYPFMLGDFGRTGNFPSFFATGAELSVVQVPEPATLGLLGPAVICFLAAAFQRRKKARA